MDRNPDPTPDACPFATDVVAAIHGELTDARQREYETHVPSCSSCRDEEREARAVLRDLRQLPGHPGGVDLWPSVRQTVEYERPRRAWLQIAAGSSAAAAILLLISLIVPASNTPEPGQRVAPLPARVSIERGTRWLASVQEADGSWRSDRWGGEALYDVGLTGLCVAALTAAPDDEAIRASLDRGVHYLLRSQRSDGRFGPPGHRSLYNHGPATVGLLRLQRDRSWAALRPALRRAVAHIVATQGQDGGWGYTDAPASTNPIVSAWAIEALTLAREQRLGSVDACLDRATTWLASLEDTSGRPGYGRPDWFPYGQTTLASIGDWTRRVTGRDPSSPMAQAPENLVATYYLVLARPHEAPRETLRRICREQHRHGSLAGSWPLNDRWATDGGRLYTTAISLLILGEVDRAL